MKKFYLFLFFFLTFFFFLGGYRAYSVEKIVPKDLTNNISLIDIDSINGERRLLTINKNETKDLYKEKEEVVEVFSYNNKTLYITEDDLNLMAKIVHAESKGEPQQGKIAVASVILNRVTDPKFPDTIREVIMQKNAFSCVVNGEINVTPNEASYAAVYDAIKGVDPTNEALFFYNPSIATCSWMKNVEKKKVTNIGHHVFFCT